MKKNKPFRELCFHSLKKNLLIMRIALVLMILGILEVHATDAYAQKTKLCLSFSDAELVTVLDKIESESEFFFLYNEKLLDTYRKVSIDAKDQLIDSILDKLFAGTDVKYTIIGRKIILAPEYLTKESLQQQGKISGTVTDENGTPLAGVNISVQGTTMGAISDVNGKYALSITAPNAVLVFSFIGYNIEKVPVEGKLVIDVKMVSTIRGLEEVVVVGYGTQRRKTLTGAISSVKTEDLQTVNALSIDNLLQGKAAGLNIVQRSSQPGGGLDVNIRGKLSPNGSNEPLYVIDGVPLTSLGYSDANAVKSRDQATLAGQVGNAGQIGYTQDNTDRSPLSTLNPSDIASIDILKDASATAIYGSAAANGVILITTKKGKKGRITVAYDGSYSIQKNGKYWDMLNGPDYMSQVNLAQKENWLYTNKFAPYGTKAVAGTFTPYYSQNQIDAASTYNHVDDIMRVGTIDNQNVSISGGTDKTAYYISFNYYDQKSILKTTGFTRYSGRINIDQTFNKCAKLTLNSTYSETVADNPSSGGMLPNGNAAFQTNAALSFDPSVPLLRHDTVTVNTSPKTPNPASWFYKKDKTYTSRIFFSPNLEITMGKNLKANVIFGIDKTSAERDVYSPFQAKLPEAKENNFGGFSNSYNTNYSAETYLSYNQQFNVHKLSLVAGLGYYRAEGLGYGMSIFNFPTEAYANYNLAVSADKDKSLYNSNKYGRNKLSQFTRLNYTLMDKYILGFTARRDGSSVFAEGKKWGIFPGVSAAWILSEEPFLKSNNLISNLKLRAGYGSTGNESVAITGDYAFNKYAPAAGISYYTGSLYRVGVVQTQLGNNKIKWETDVTTNIGLDIGLLNNRLNATVEYYVRTANDLLDFTNLTSTAVLPTIAKNVGSTQSKGFEIEFRGEIIKTEDIGLSTYVTLSHNKSSWLKRNPEVTLGAWIGEKDGINDIYGWKTDGIFKSYQEVQDYTSNGKVLQPGSYPGNVKFIDQNGDGVLDYKDIVNLGSRDPKINFGFGANFRYKNFDLNVNTYGAAGMKTFNGWLIYSDLKNMINPGANESVYIKNSWSSENPNGTIPGVARGIEIGNNPLDQSNKGEAFFGSRSGNDFSMKSSYYFRVKNITFSYTLPKALLFNNKIAQSAKVFIDLQNVQLFTNYVGIDPEMEQNAAPFPIPFTIATGINIVF